VRQGKGRQPQPPGQVRTLQVVAERIGELQARLDVIRAQEDLRQEWANDPARQPLLAQAVAARRVLAERRSRMQDEGEDR